MTSIPESIYEKGIPTLINKYNEGETNSQLAYFFDVSQTTIKKALAILREQGRISYRNEANDANLSKSELLKLLNLKGSRQKVAKSLQMSPKTINSLCEKFNIMDNRTWSKKINKALKENLKNIKFKEPKYKLKKTGVSIVIALSDWHVSKIIKDDNGNIVYNMSIYKTRIENYIKQLLKILDRHMKLHLNIEEVVVLGLGDFANGENIYPTQAYNQTEGPPFQVMAVVKSTIKIIEAILTRSIPVKFYGVKGNHGSMGKDSDPSSNWDLMIYMILKWWQNFQNKKNLSIKFTESDYYRIKIRKWDYLLRHMAYVQDETAAGQAKYLGWKAIHNADVITSAHYHHWDVNARKVMNASLCGGDDLSERMAKEENNPSQLVWVVTDTVKLTDIYPIILKED